jgi:hypothetical protein
MKNTPQYRFFRVISGGDLVDIDIFQYPDKTKVIVSMIYYKNEQIILVSKSDVNRKSAIKLAMQSFELTKKIYESKCNPPPLEEIPL